MSPTALRSPRPSIVAVLVAALVAACSAAPGGRPPAVPVRTPVAATVPPTAEPVLGEAPEAVVAQVRADLAERVGGYASAAVRIVRSEAVTWPVGSLGCPEPGMTYPALETPGYWIVLEVDGREYDYRVPERGTPRLCARRMPANPGG